jgi:predicted nucleotide-binding protein
MQISRTEYGIRIPKSVIAEALAILLDITEADSVDDGYHQLRIFRGQERYRLDSVDEWYGEYDPSGVGAELYSSPSRSDDAVHFVISGGEYPKVECAVVASSRANAMRLMQPFRDAANDPANKVELPDAAEPVAPAVRVFLGHGRSGDWRIIKDEFQDKHGIAVEAYESGSRAGHAIKDVLESMLDQSTIAFLIMTGEDIQGDGTARARQNVVHEAGLFQGRLGFSKAIAVVEEGVEVFSNLDGIQQVRFEKGHVKSAISEMLAVIKREFPVP